MTAQSEKWPNARRTFEIERRHGEFIMMQTRKLGG